MSVEAKENTEPDNVNVGLIATITVVGALLVLSIALALTALVRSETKSYSDQIGAYGDLGGVKRLKEEQIGKLQAPPGWADDKKSAVAVPIDRAMLSVLTDIRKDPEKATAPGAAPAPAEGAAPAAPTAETAPATENK